MTSVVTMADIEALAKLNVIVYPPRQRGGLPFRIFGFWRSRAACCSRPAPRCLRSSASAVPTIASERAAERFFRRVARAEASIDPDELDGESIVVTGAVLEQVSITNVQGKRASTRAGSSRRPVIT